MMTGRRADSESWSGSRWAARVGLPLREAPQRVRLTAFVRSIGDAVATARPAHESAQGRRAASEHEEVETVVTRLDEGDTRQRLEREMTAIRDFRERSVFQVVVFGIRLAGKTSLVNVLLDRASGQSESRVETDRQDEPQVRTVEGPEGTLILVDTPGLFEPGPDGEAREAQALALAERADLLLFVAEHDLVRSEFNALASLVRRGKRAIVVLNKKDRFLAGDFRAIQETLRERLTGLVAPEDVVFTAAAPRPVAVRVRRPDASEETVLEFEAPDLNELEERIAAILACEGDRLRASNILLREYLLRKAAEETLARQRREKAEEVIERHQWMAAASAFAVPIPELDMIAAGAVEFRMVSEIAQVYGLGLSPEHIRMISAQMVQALLGRRIVETAVAMISGIFKSSLIGYAAGGMVQAVTIAYLTRITGRTFLDYFECGQDWGEGGMQGALARQIGVNGRTEFLKEFCRQVCQRLVDRVSTFWRTHAGAAGKPPVA